MIRKWEIYPIDAAISIPAEAEVIHVGQQGGLPVVWTNDVPESIREGRRAYHLQVYGTGMTPSATDKHVGSVQMPSGFVWHVFRLRGGLGDGLDDA